MLVIWESGLSGKDHTLKRRTLSVRCVHVCKLGREGDAEGVTKTDFVSECASLLPGAENCVPSVCLVGKPGRK